MPAPGNDFNEALAAIGVELEPMDRERLARYLELLYDANEKMNLTGVPAEAAWTRHIFDSLTLVPWLASLAQESRAADPASPPLRVLDVGSGGGLPGVALAIVMPSLAPGCEVTLLEATGKKARFLETLVKPIDLDNVRVFNDRAETAAHDRRRHREFYDAVVSRAVGALPVLVELTLPFVRPGGFAMYIKGERAIDEIEQARHAIGLLGGAFVETQTTPTGTLVRLEKCSRTPRTYPRTPGEPARCPLQRSKRSPA